MTDERNYEYIESNYLELEALFTNFVNIHDEIHSLLYDFGPVVGWLSL